MYHVECELSNVHFVSYLIPHSLLVLRSALFQLCTNLSPLPAHAHERNYALDENVVWGISVCKVTAFDRSDAMAASNVGISSTFIQAVSEERSTESRVHSYLYPWICSCR